MSGTVQRLVELQIEDSAVTAMEWWMDNDIIVFAVPYYGIYLLDLFPVAGNCTPLSHTHDHIISMLVAQM
jgi:hypothetical protein